MIVQNFSKTRFTLKIIFLYGIINLMHQQAIMLPLFVDQHDAGKLRDTYHARVLEHFRNGEVGIRPEEFERFKNKNYASTGLADTQSKHNARAAQESIAQACILSGNVVCKPEDVKKLSYHEQELLMVALFKKLMNDQDAASYRDVVPYLLSCSVIASSHPELFALFDAHNTAPQVQEFVASFNQLASKKLLPPALLECHKSTTEKIDAMGTLEKIRYQVCIAQKFS